MLSKSKGPKQKDFTKVKNKVGFLDRRDAAFIGRLLFSEGIQGPIYTVYVFNGLQVSKFLEGSWPR